MEYKDVEKDCQVMNKDKDLIKKIDKQKQDMYFTEKFIETQTANVCSILINNKFIECSNDRLCNSYLPDNSYEMTILGTIASNIAEIHPLIVSELLETWDHFAGFTPVQLVGLFSCFTGVRLPQDEKMNFPDCDDAFLKFKIEELIHGYEKYDTLEGELYLQTGIQYEDALIFDLIDLSMKWCNCEDELTCRQFIENEVKQYNISIGDFTKAYVKNRYY